MLTLSKDSYSFPRIEDTLDSLNGAVWFTALDLNSFPISEHGHLLFH